MTKTRSVSATTTASSSTLQSGSPVTPASGSKQAGPHSHPPPTTEPTPAKGPGVFDDDNDLEEINSALHTNNLYLGNPELLQHVKWVESGRQRQLVLKDDDGECEPAILEWIGDISPWNFWLYACGGWNGELGPNNNWSKATPFEKAKARAHIRAPSHPTLAADWDKNIMNLKALMTTVLDSSQNKTTSHSLLDGDEIKMRHAIFEVSTQNH